MAEAVTDHMLNFGVLLGHLRACSTPVDKVARHLLALDINETYWFAARHPEKLTEEPAEAPR